MVVLEIRPCRLEECEAVLDLWGAYHTPGITDNIEDIRRLVETFDDCLLVALVENDIVGAIIAGWDGWRGHLHHLAVRPEVRRQGVAKALVEAAERRLRDKGAKRVSVLTERDNAAAISFYESLGELGYGLDARMQRYTKRL
jgi:ribosomal protein S18 acetylase RimI-like enzyme